MMLTWSTAISGFMAALSTALFGMVVMVLMAQETGDPVVVWVGVVILVAIATTCLTASLTKSLSPAVVPTAGLTVVSATSTGAVRAEVVVHDRAGDVVVVVLVAMATTFSTASLTMAPPRCWKWG